MSEVDMATREHNKSTVVAYCTKLINERRPAEAVARYVAPQVRQHNPQASDGAPAIVAFMTRLVAENPEVHLDIRRVIADDDLVVTHSLITLSPGGLGTAVVDIYRLVEGRIVEHWDVMQPVPVSAANDNTMF